CAAGPTAAMRSPRINTTWLFNRVPLLLSNSRPARTAMVAGAAAHLLAPPSIPKHGGVPAPRHGLPFPPRSWETAGPANAANRIAITRLRMSPPRWAKACHSLAQGEDFLNRLELELQSQLAGPFIMLVFIELAGNTDITPPGRVVDVGGFGEDGDMVGHLIARTGIQLAKLLGVLVGQRSAAQRVQVFGTIGIGQSGAEAILLIKELRRADIARLVEQGHQVGATGQAVGMA